MNEKTPVVGKIEFSPVPVELAVKAQDAASFWKAKHDALEREVAELRERPFVTAAPKDDELVLTIPGFGSALFRACGDIGRELVDRLRSEHSAQGGTPNERSSEGTNRGDV